VTSTYISPFVRRHDDPTPAIRIERIVQIEADGNPQHRRDSQNVVPMSIPNTTSSLYSSFLTDILIRRGHSAQVYQVRFEVV
jgi:dipeptidase